MRKGVSVIARIIKRAANSPVGCNRNSDAGSPSGPLAPEIKAATNPTEGKARSAQRKYRELRTVMRAFLDIRMKRTHSRFPSFYLCVFQGMEILAHPAHMLIPAVVERER